MTTDDAEGTRHRYTVTRIIGESGQGIADVHRLSDEELMMVYNDLACAHAEAHDMRAVVVNEIKSRWPDMFKPEPELIEQDQPEWVFHVHEDGSVELDDSYPAIKLLTHDLLVRIEKYPDGNFPLEELKRIRAIGEEIYRRGSTVDLQIARSMVEDLAGESMRKRLDRIWYSDLERIPFDRVNRYFKELDWS